MSSAGRSFLERFRRHERALAVAYLFGAGVIVVGFVVAPIRIRVLDRIQAVANWWDERWMRRLREAERLVEAGDLVQANAYLVNLDRSHPARNVRHGRDKEREFILRLLGRSYESLGKSSRAIETYQRLVAFDSMHYRNHWELAEASARLLSGWAEAPEARDAYAAVLRIYPAHLPSLRGYVRYYMDRGEFIPIVTMFQTYLDAHFVQAVTVSLGGASLSVPALVDGRLHDYDLPLVADAAAGAELELASGGFPIEIDRLVLVPAARVGRAAPIDSVLIDRGGGTLVSMVPAEHGAYRPLALDAGIRYRTPAAGPVARVRVRMALFKPIDDDLWSAVGKSYANLLRDRERDEAALRTVVFPTAAAADSVLSRRVGADEGLVLSRAQLDRMRR